MKQLTKPGVFKYYVTLLLFTLMQTLLWAQEGEGGGSSSSSTTSETKVRVTSTEASDWYTSPWVWIAGAAVFILLLVALTSRGSSSRTTVIDRGGRSDRTTVTKTVQRDTDVDPGV